MARTKQRKVGDRIFYECWDGSIGAATIKKIEPTESYFDKFGNRLKDGKKYKFNYYHTSDNEVIEDYNCLSESDHRVKEFLKNNKFFSSSFHEDLKKWLHEHGWDKSLQELADTFE